MKLYCLCILLWLSIGMIEADAGILAREKYEDYQEKFDKQIAALHEKVESVERRQADPKSQADVEAAVKQIVISEMDKHRSARFALQASNETRAAFELDDLEVFINKLDSRLKSVEGLRSDVSSLKSQVSNLGDRFCQTGEVGCDPCNVKDEKGGSSSTHKDVKKSVTFSPAFTKTPVVMLIQKHLWMKASGDEDWFGWVFKTSSVSKSGFQATIEMWDTTMDEFWVQWVACSS